MKYGIGDVVFAVGEGYKLPMKNREVIECKVVGIESTYKESLTTEGEYHLRYRLEALENNEIKSREFWLYYIKEDLVFNNKDDANTFCVKVNKDRKIGRDDYIDALEKAYKYSYSILHTFNISEAKTEYGIEVDIRFPSMRIDGRDVERF